MRAVRCLALPLLALAATSAAGQDPEEFIGRLDVLGPPEEAGTYIAGVADPFHAPIPPPSGIGPLPLALARSIPVKGLPEATPERGCNTYENPEEVSGRVALVRDGGPCTLLDKYLNAAQAGAAAVVIHADEPVGAADDSTLQDIWWPPDVIIFLHGLYATPYRGERLRAAVEAGEEVTVVLRSEPSTAAETTSGAEGSGLTLAVRPNPARGSALVTVGVDRPQALTVEVLDGLGRRVALVHEGALGPGAAPLQVDLAALPVGSYFVRVSGGGSTLAHPLFLVR